MRTLLALAAMAMAMASGIGAAHAQTVADLGMAGMDPRSGKPPKQVVIFFHGYTQRGVAMKALADTLARAQVVGWIDPTAAAWITATTRIPTVLSARP